MRRPPPATPARRRGFSLVELMLVVVIIGLLAVVSTTEFTTFLGRSKRAEVTLNLRAAGRLEMMYEQDNRTFSPFPAVIAFMPERNNRYAYIFRHSCAEIEDRSGTKPVSTATQTCIGIDNFVIPGAARYPTTLDENATTGDLLISAVGNLDPDSDYDEWSLTNLGRPEGAVTTNVTCANMDASAYEPCITKTDI